MYLIKYLLTQLFRLSLILLIIWLAIRSYIWVTSAEPVALRFADYVRASIDALPALAG